MHCLSFLLAVTTTVFFCTTLLAPDRAYACSCAVEAGVTKQERVQEAFSQANAVFAGKVTGVEDPPPSSVVSSADPVTVTFDVSEAWKGVQAETLEITTPMSGASCGYEFKAGEEYLVYAPEDMEIWLCGETKLLSDAKVDLETLGAADALPDTSGAVGPRYLVLYSVVGAASLAGVLATLALVISKKSSRRT